MSMDEILGSMLNTLKNERQPRITALKSLQKEQSGDPFKILIATVLSARTRDENTTLVIKSLFSKFKNPSELAGADIKEIKESIHSTGFYNIKAARIQEIARILVEKYNGLVPDNLEGLLSLPGVGRKTANCVLVYGFSKPAIPVDTHVHRISNRLGIVRTKTPEETEYELARTVKQDNWIGINNVFVMYGQNVCLPRNPRCDICKLKDCCQYNKNNTAQLKQNSKRS